MTEWMQAAACKTADTALFFPPYEPAAALDICAICPVTDQCARDAVKAGDWESIRGGMTGEQRKRWAKRHGLPRHGIVTGYTVDKCRCVACVRVYSESRDREPSTGLSPHGTDAAYRRHYRRGEPACEACRDAHNLAVQLRKEDAA